MAGIGSREGVYASGQHKRIACWIYVVHQPACALVETEGGSRFIRFKLVVQNLCHDVVAVSLDAAQSFSLQLRDGSVIAPLVVRPAPTFTDAKAQSCALPVHIDQAASRCAAPRPGPNETLMQPLACASAELSFQALPLMHFEPEMLEACRELRMRVSKLDEGVTDVSSCGTMPCAAGAPVEVSCRFNGGDFIWRHYEQINRAFYA